jgi:hypothetical protein
MILKVDDDDCEYLLYDKGRDHGGYGFDCLNGDFVLVMVVVCDGGGLWGL